MGWAIAEATFREEGVARGWTKSRTTMERRELREKWERKIGGVEYTLMPLSVEAQASSSDWEVQFPYWTLIKDKFHLRTSVFTILPTALQSIVRGPALSSSKANVSLKFCSKPISQALLSFFSVPCRDSNLCNHL